VCSAAGREVPTPDSRTVLEIGPRVYLRHPTAGDEREILTRNRASRALHRGWVTAPVEHRAFTEWIRRLEDPNTRLFLVCRREDDAIAGIFALNQIVRRLFQSAYMGYYGLRPFNGQGYMREGMELVLRQVFLSLKLHRVEANIQPENTASIALAKSSGFRREGYSPRYLKIAGRWRDHERWAMLVDDWREFRRRGN
jgi:ribosomal-protein-alanine N-acetyltransferase